MFAIYYMRLSRGTCQYDSTLLVYLVSRMSYGQKQYIYTGRAIGESWSLAGWLYLFPHAVAGRTLSARSINLSDTVLVLTYESTRVIARQGAQTTCRKRP